MPGSKHFVLWMLIVSWSYWSVVKVSAPLDNTCLDRSTCCRYPVLPFSPPDVFVHVFSRYPPAFARLPSPGIGTTGQIVREQNGRNWHRLERNVAPFTHSKGEWEQLSECKTVRPEHSCVCLSACVQVCVRVWRGGLKTKGFRGGGLTLFVSVHLWRLHMNRAEERIWKERNKGV